MRINELLESVSDDPVDDLKRDLMGSRKKLHGLRDDEEGLYKTIDSMMKRISKKHSITGDKLHDLWVKRYRKIPDKWILEQ
jgi:hypothetical protein